MILALRTDNPQAEIYLYSASGQQLGQHTWHAHRELSNTLLTEIKNLLDAKKATFSDLTGIAVYRGPGSFTGLRIGVTVANTLAYSLGIPIASATGETWQTDCTHQLQAGHNSQIVLPEYGAEAHITLPKK